MTRQKKIQDSAYYRERHKQNPEPGRIRARNRKTLILIDRARREALRMLQAMVVA